MKIYIIRQRGIYWHHIIETHADKLLAIKRCNELAKSDCDSYHDWVVTEHQVGVINTGNGVDEYDSRDQFDRDQSEVLIYKTDRNSLERIEGKYMDV